MVTMGMKDQIRTDIFKFLKENGIMSLATRSPKGLWVCTVYYGIDDNMNLYIVTNPGSIHGKSMAKNNMVAFNIFDSRQKIYKSKKGLQGWGIIEMIEGTADIAKALKLWHKQNPGMEEAITPKKVQESPSTKIFCITPKYLKFFNKELYPSEEFGIWEV